MIRGLALSVRAIGCLVGLHSMRHTATWRQTEQDDGSLVNEAHPFSYCTLCLHLRRP